MKNKLKFWEAYKIWKNNSKTILGETITLGTLFILAISGIVEGIFSFVTEKILEIWTSKKK